MSKNDEISRDEKGRISPHGISRKKSTCKMSEFAVKNNRPPAENCGRTIFRIAFKSVGAAINVIDCD